MEFKSVRSWTFASGWIALLAVVLSWIISSSINIPSAQYDPAKEKFIILEAENKLMKQMLGQVQGKVIILSPSVEGGKYCGKLVWDESRQAGFVATTTLPTLPQGKVFKVFVRSEKQFYAQSQPLHPNHEGKLLSMFEVSKPIFKATEFRIAVDDPSSTKPPQDYLLIGR